MKNSMLLLLVMLSLGCGSSSKTGSQVDAAADLAGADQIDGIGELQSDGQAQDGTTADVPPKDQAGDLAGSDSGSDLNDSDGVIPDDLTGPDGDLEDVVTPKCGDGVENGLEECDAGQNNGKPGIPCTLDCKDDSDSDGSIDSVDCAPNDPSRFPGADEICNTLDDDCDSLVDDLDSDVKVVTPYYLDCDGDDTAAPGAEAVLLCAPPVPVAECPNAQFVTLKPHPETPFSEDCNDADPTTSPLSPEVCDAMDNDCDGLADEEASDAILWYPDCDGDTLTPNNGASPVSLCDMAPGQPPEACQEGTWTAIAPSLAAPALFDCNDFDDSMNSIQKEYCDGKDNDCNQEEDDGVVTHAWYADCDGDWYAEFEADSQPNCKKPDPPFFCPAGSWTVQEPEGENIDCDDTNPDVNPGQAGYFGDPIPGKTGVAAWDYNCDGNASHPPISPICNTSGKWACPSGVSSAQACTAGKGVALLSSPSVCYLDLPTVDLCGQTGRTADTCILIGGALCSKLMNGYGFKFRCH